MKLNANTAASRAKKPHCFLRIPARCYLWDLQQQTPLGEGSAQARTSQAQKQKYQAFIRSSRAELCPGAPVPPSWGWGSAAAGSPHPQDTTSLSSSLWIPLSCCCQLWVGQTKELPLGKARHRKGRGKNKLKKNKPHTGHSYHYEKVNELLYIHMANNFTSWEMRLLSLLLPWGWRVLVCWILAWDVQSHTESMLSVVVGVLNKVDGVGASGWILFDLEVLCWQAKGAQHQIAQILQFTQHFFL